MRREEEKRGRYDKLEFCSIMQIRFPITALPSSPSPLRPSPLYLLLCSSSNDVRLNWSSFYRITSSSSLGSGGTGCGERFGRGRAGGGDGGVCYGSAMKLIVWEGGRKQSRAVGCGRERAGRRRAPTPAAAASDPRGAGAGWAADQPTTKTALP